MFVGIMDLPFPRIYVPTNISECNELSRIVMQQTSYPRNGIPANQQSVDNSRTLDPTNWNDSTVHVYQNSTPTSNSQNSKQGVNCKVKKCLFVDWVM